MSTTDGPSGVSDTFTYGADQGTGDYGQVAGVTESWPWDTSGSQHGYGVAYQYSPFGDRSNTTYTTDNGTTRWQYADYWCFGFAGANGYTRAPQTMRQLDSNGNITPEE